jgi:quercetin dioxygenase-like cupin family protein
LVSFLAVGAAVGGTVLLVGAAAAVEPTADVSVVSRAILLDRVDIAVPQSSDVEMAEVTIQPGGTTGLRRYGGPGFVSVLGGLASRHEAAGAACRSTTVPSGVAYTVSAGVVDEIRNDGAVPLHLQTTSLAPAGEPWAAPAPVTPGCPRTIAKDVAVAVLTHTAVTVPGRITTNGPSDLLVVRLVVPPGARAGGWHSHPTANLVSVEAGRFDVTALVQGRCVRGHLLQGTAAVEPGGQVHEAYNEGSDTTTAYDVAFSTSDGPFLIPTTPPCDNSK